MWWNQAGWGPMYGWWFMPFFVFFIFRIFNRNGGRCGPFIQGTPRDNQGQDELLDEIRTLRREVDELRKNRKERGTLL